MQVMTRMKPKPTLALILGFFFLSPSFSLVAQEAESPVESELPVTEVSAPQPSTTYRPPVQYRSAPSATASAPLVIDDLVPEAAAEGVNTTFLPSSGLEVLGIREPQDVVRYAANQSATDSGSRSFGDVYSVRGLTNTIFFGAPSTTIYVDDVPFGETFTYAQDLGPINSVEVLRGPQGTLFGKNTTAGAFNVTTRKPSFTTGASFEANYGNYGFIQSKLSLTGPLSKTFAARVSFSGTQRDGLLEHAVTERFVNDLNNLGIRGQLVYTPSNNLSITLTADATRQRPDGYAQVFAGVAPTKRPGYRQFDSIISSLNYTLPSRNPFDRTIDHDTPWRSNIGPTQIKVGNVTLSHENGRFIWSCTWTSFAMVC
jgi:outer membrane receptor protein involved in Fe transport